MLQTSILEYISAANDTDQVIVSTLGRSDFVMGVAAGSRATHWLGQMSNDCESWHF